jgi:hypothetical protein
MDQGAGLLGLMHVTVEVSSCFHFLLHSICSPFVSCWAHQFPVSLVVWRSHVCSVLHRFGCLVS